MILRIMCVLVITAILVFAPCSVTSVSSAAIPQSSAQDGTLKSLAAIVGAGALESDDSLTQIGRRIIAPLGGMCRWAKRYGRGVSADVHLPDMYQTQ
jgi:hypothetical protein